VVSDEFDYHNFLSTLLVSLLLFHHQVDVVVVVE
jgi:hypothetical protein